MLILGFGIGISFPSLMTVAMSSATESDAGLASGLVNTSVQVGGALGLAVLATLSATRSDDLRHAGHSAAAALTSGYHLAFLIGAGLVVAALGLAVTVLRPERQANERAHACGEPAYSEAA
jgi:MFS family permease